MKTTNSDDYRVIQLQRLRIRDGAREQFAEQLHTGLSQADEPAGATDFGQLYERAKASQFTWLRGYRDLQAGAAVNSTDYYAAPARALAGARQPVLVEHTEVLLLRPLHAHSMLSLLPAVDPRHEPDGARGIVVIHIFPVLAGQLDAFARAAEHCFAAYRSHGLVEAGILVSLDVQDRRTPADATDVLVWLGVVKDERALDQLGASLVHTAHTLAASAMQSGDSELVVLDPAARSRLRWRQHAHAA